MARLKATAEAINKRLPASLGRESLEEACSDIFQAVSETTRGREWPDVALFAKSAEDRGAAAAKANPTNRVFDTVQINLRRLRNGDALGDEWIFGKRAVELLDAGASEMELDEARLALFCSIRDVWGEVPARGREDEFRLRHDDALTIAGRPRHFGTLVEAAE